MGCGESKISVANTIVLGVSNTFSLLIKSFLKVTECKELCFGRSFLRDVVHHGGEEMAEGRGRHGGGKRRLWTWWSCCVYIQQSEREQQVGLGYKARCLPLITNFLQQDSTS